MCAVVSCGAFQIESLGMYRLVFVSIDTSLYALLRGVEQVLRTDRKSRTFRMPSITQHNRCQMWAFSLPIKTKLKHIYRYIWNVLDLARFQHPISQVVVTLGLTCTANKRHFDWFDLPIYLNNCTRALYILRTCGKRFVSLEWLRALLLNLLCARCARACTITNALVLFAFCPTESGILHNNYALSFN